MAQVRKTREAQEVIVRKQDNRLFFRKNTKSKKLLDDDHYLHFGSEEQIRKYAYQHNLTIVGDIPELKPQDKDPNHLSWEEFEERFKPRKNPKNSNGIGDGWGYETYGKELDHVLKIATTEPNKVWTVVDGDSGAYSIIAGYHLVNRQAYVITKKPWDNEGLYAFDADDISINDEPEWDDN